MLHSDDDRVRAYRSGKAAAERYLWLLEQLPGEVRAIDYSRFLNTTSSRERSSVEAYADIRLERLDEFLDLDAVLTHVANTVRDDHFRVWVGMRLFGRSAGDPDLGFSAGHCFEIVRRLDRVVTDALVERGLIEGYAGRDLLEAGGSLPRGVTVWKNPIA